MSLRVNAVLGGRGKRAHAPRSGDRQSGGPETEIGPETWSAEKLLSILAKPGIGQCRAGEWVSEMKPQVWVKARSKTANA